MTSGSKADDLLARAYALNSSDESRALYRDWAETYDQSMLDGLGYLTPTKTAAMLAAFHLPRDAKILDVGSGTGLAGEALAGLGFSNIDALDYSSEMLEQAALKAVYSQTINADLNAQLQIADASYDALICTGTFTHAHVGAKCLDELFRILKPGGIFACTVHNDIWEPEGFAEKIETLETSNQIMTRNKTLGTYFSESTEPEGWFIVWEQKS